jgi:hypothetical protein
MAATDEYPSHPSSEVGRLLGPAWKSIVAGRVQTVFAPTSNEHMIHPFLDEALRGS